jgi:hypothetical protein
MAELDARTHASASQPWPPCRPLSGKARTRRNPCSMGHACALSASRHLIALRFRITTDEQCLSVPLTCTQLQCTMLYIANDRLR